MKTTFLFLIGTLFLSFNNDSTYGQYRVNIAGKNSTESILTANTSGGIIKKLEWKRDGNTVAGSDSKIIGVTVAGGNGEGNAANQLDEPEGIFVDNNGLLWIADTRNARIQKFIPGMPKRYHYWCKTTQCARIPN